VFHVSIGTPRDRAARARRGLLPSAVMGTIGIEGAPAGLAGMLALGAAA
jgi:hypothetical protein